MACMVSYGIHGSPRLCLPRHMRKKVVRTPFARVNLRPAVMMILQEWFNLSHPQINGPMTERLDDVPCTLEIWKFSYWMREVASQSHTKSNAKILKVIIYILSCEPSWIYPSTVPLNAPCLVPWLFSVSRVLHPIRPLWSPFASTVISSFAHRR